MSRALVAHLQAAANIHNTHNIPSTVCVSPPEDEQVLLKTCIGL
jgi:hypothetical protein